MKKRNRKEQWDYFIVQGGYQWNITNTFTGLFHRWTMKVKRRRATKFSTNAFQGNEDKLTKKSYIRAPDTRKLTNKTEKQINTCLQSNAHNWEKTLTVQKMTDSEVMTTNYNWEFVIKIGYCENISSMLTTDQKSKLDVGKQKTRNPNSTRDIFQGAPNVLIVAMGLIILFWNR